VYPVAVEAFTAGPPLHPHRASVLTMLGLVASAALLVAPMLVGLHHGFNSAESLPVALAPAAAEAESEPAIFEQFIELDEVLITSTNEEEDGR
jgi:hypothetical protein